MKLSTYFTISIVIIAHVEASMISKEMVSALTLMAVMMGEVKH